MELKKSPEANLEKTRPVFIIAGLVFAIGLVFTSIEYKTYGKEISDLGTIEVEEEDMELPPITRATPPPPPPPPPPPVAPQQLEVVEDDVEIEEEIEIEEIDEDYEVEPIIEDIPDEVVEEIFQRVENMPLFPGCEDEPSDQRDQCTQRKMMEHAARNYSVPPQLRAHGISGRIFVKFVVDTDGSITNVEVMKGLHKLADEEAIRVVKSMPKMKPGEQLGKKVKVQYMLPFNVKSQ